MPSGYSNTPLEKKLGLKEGYAVLLYGAPEDYFERMEESPAGLREMKRIRARSADLIHLFLRSQKELEKQAARHIEALTINGMLWISWPKGGSGMETDLKRDLIREYILGLGLVDVKVMSFDELWSGLKFVYRLADRKTAVRKS